MRSRDDCPPITAHLEVALGARHVQVRLGLQLAHARVLVGERAAVHLGRLQVARVQHLDWCVTIVISMDISIYIIGRRYLLGYDNDLCRQPTTVPISGEGYKCQCVFMQLCPFSA